MSGSAREPEGRDLGTIGPYRLLELIGEGGMGQVLLAEAREPLPRRVAVKVMRSDRVDRHLRARFELEQQALARMDHPNIARIFDSGITQQDQPWFAMEYVPGLPLTDYCDTHRLSVEERLALFRQVCDGVHHAHMRGILHRDLKPSNILVREVDDRPVAKIIDFGLARPVDPAQLRATLHEELRRIIGTIAYMSPEQAGLTPEDVDTRTDVYSLGVVLYELVIGALPFGVDELLRLGPLALPSFLRDAEPRRPSERLSDLGPEIADVAARRRSAPRRLRAMVAGELEWITMKALERDRHRRYESARDLALDLERLQADRPVSAGPPKALYRLRKWSRRHAAGLAVSGVLVAAGTATAAATLVLAGQAAAAEARRELSEIGSVAAALLREADEDLWPVGDAVVPRAEAWLRRVSAQLDRRSELTARAAAAVMESRPAAGESTATEEQLRMQQTIAAFDRLLVARRSVEERIARSRTLAQRCQAAAATSWSTAIAEIAASPRYGGFRMPEMPGLVPLGANAQGCHEFLLLESDVDGVPPVRRSDGGFDVRPGDGLVFVLVPGGPTRTGASKVDGERNFDAAALKNETPQDHVLDPFLLSRYEMTQDQWARMVHGGPAEASVLDEHHPSNKPSGLQSVAHGPGFAFTDEASATDPNWLHPVQQIDWVHCELRLRRWGLSLPPLVEWEHACRAGTSTPWAFDKEHAGACANLWNIENGADAVDGFVWTAPVGSFQSNGFGFHDMHGNVAELCADYPSALLGYDAPRGSQRTDPRKTQRAVHRGGSYAVRLPAARSAAFQQIPIVNIETTVGVRPFLSVPRNR